MANKRIIELQERTQLDMNDYLIVDSSTSTRKLSMSTLLNYMTMTQMIFVTELPTEDISTSTIYLVPHSGSNTQWDEYIYRENAWVLIGTSTIDLSAIYQTNDKATIQNNDIPWYGTSSTTAATAAKIATTTDRNLGALAAGQKVTIKFTYANTASNPTLNVDSKGAKTIKAYGTTTPTVWWNADDVVTFTYDGTYWIMGATTGQIQQLNNDLAPVHGTLTFDGNWGGSVFQLRKVGKQVSLYFKYQTGKNTNFTSDKVATLPEGFRPDTAIYMPTVKINSTGMVPTGHGYVVCLANGDVNYYGDAFAFQEYIFVNGSFVMD